MSVGQLVHRVVDTIADWGKEGGMVLQNEDLLKLYENLVLARAFEEKMLELSSYLLRQRFRLNNYP